MLGSLSDAEDAVQHTFIAAHSDIQRHGDRDLHVKAWLYTIARNRCLSMLRARREQVSNDDIEIASDRFEHDLQQREELRALVADVAKLPDEQREALVLAEVGDLSHEDISAIIGCEASKVKSLVFQARSALIDRRIARDTPCEEVREQIATLRGGALRRSSLKHHIDACPGCAEYREEVRRQRAMLALALPVVPSAALKSSIFGGIGGGGGAAALGGGFGAGGLGLGLATQTGLAAKLGIAALLAVGAGTGVSVATGHGVPLVHTSSSPSTVESRSADAVTADGSTPKGASLKAAAARHDAAVAATKTGAKKSHTRSAAGTEHGFTPSKHGSSGDAARQFAATRGQGKHSGITKAHTPTRAHGTPTTKKAHTKHVAPPRTRSHAAPQAQTRPAPVKPAPPAPVKTAPTTTPKTQAPSTTQPTPSPTPAPQATTPPPTPAAPTVPSVDKKRSTGTSG